MSFFSTLKYKSVVIDSKPTEKMRRMHVF